MQLDEQIQQHVLLLPPELKSEVLDFVLFLEQKQAKQSYIELNEQQQQNFVESLLNPKPSNDKLKRSAQSYKNNMGL